MAVTATVFTTLACLLHVFIFYMESLAWAGPRARTAFGMTAEQARNTRELAFNQGFYNLFLAIETIIGAILIGAGSGAAVPVGTALVLALRSPAHRGAALAQGSPPAVAVVRLALGMLLG